MVEKRRLQKNFGKFLTLYYFENNEFSLTKCPSASYLPNDLNDSMVKLWILVNSS